MKRHESLTLLSRARRKRQKGEGVGGGAEEMLKRTLSLIWYYEAVFSGLPCCSTNVIECIERDKVVYTIRLFA